MRAILRRVRKNKKGFTLMEAIVTIAVLAVTSLIFAVFLLTSTRIITMSLDFDTDRADLIEAIESGDSLVGENITLTDENNKTVTFTFKVDDTTTITSTAEGKYVTVERVEDGRRVKYVIFVADTAQNGGQGGSNG